MAEPNKGFDVSGLEESKKKGFDIEGIESFLSGEERPKSTTDKVLDFNIPNPFLPLPGVTTTPRDSLEFIVDQLPSLGSAAAQQVPGAGRFLGPGGAFAGESLRQELIESPTGQQLFPDKDPSAAIEFTGDPATDEAILEASFGLLGPFARAGKKIPVVRSGLDLLSTLNQEIRDKLTEKLVPVLGIKASGKTKAAAGRLAKQGAKLDVPPLALEKARMISIIPGVVAPFRTKKLIGEFSSRIQGNIRRLVGFNPRLALKRGQMNQLRDISKQISDNFNTAVIERRSKAIGDIVKDAPLHTQKIEITPGSPVDIPWEGFKLDETIGKASELLSKWAGDRSGAGLEASLPDRKEAKRIIELLEELGNVSAVLDVQDGEAPLTIAGKSADAALKNLMALQEEVLKRAPDFNKAQIGNDDLTQDLFNLLAIYDNEIGQQLNKKGKAAFDSFKSTLETERIFSDNFGLQKVLSENGVDPSKVRGMLTTDAGIKALRQTVGNDNAVKEAVVDNFVGLLSKNSEQIDITSKATGKVWNQYKSLLLNNKLITPQGAKNMDDFLALGQEFTLEQSPFAQVAFTGRAANVGMRVNEGLLRGILGAGTALNAVLNTAATTGSVVGITVATNVFARKVLLNPRVGRIALGLNGKDLRKTATRKKEVRDIMRALAGVPATLRYFNREGELQELNFTIPSTADQATALREFRLRSSGNRGL